MKKRDPKDLEEKARDKHPGLGEQAGEAVGGISGTVAGAALGSIAGPIGIVVGGIAGAVGGWWAGEKVGRAAEDMGEHDAFYRKHWDENRRADLEWEDARVGYAVGHIAGRNPDYTGMSYEEIEPDIRRGWTWKQRDYEVMQPYVRLGYDRTMGKPQKKETTRMERKRSEV